MSKQSEQYLEERVQNFLDSEVLQGDKEKVLYLRLYNRLRPFKQKKIFSDQLAFRFFERDCKEDYDSLGFGGLSDVVEQSQIVQEFYDNVKQDDYYADYFEQDYNRYKVALMLSDPYKSISTWRAEESVEVSEL
tara:strand:- start:1398 stop:1799 length:402 start_codon:yes stop_codon:yes gene_type:complete